MPVSLYIHFPFCVRKCSYCDFNSFADYAVPFGTYVDAVVREMELRAALLPVDVPAETLYLGGGTPSLLPPELVCRIVEAAQRLYRLSVDAEITIEANPGTVTGETLRGFRGAGVNRLSLGLQSLDDRFLQCLGRVHSAREGLEAYDAARAAGFDNVGIDLIHSLPEQTVDDWLADLRKGISLSPDHVSAYGLTVEEGTPLHRMQQAGDLHLPPEDAAVRMFELTAEVLADNGYEHYEISNFARSGFRSRHNQIYWTRDSYVGFGAGAHSFSARPGFGRRWRNENDPAAYVEEIEAGAIRDRESVLLEKSDAMSEWMFLGLRMREGVREDVFSDLFRQSIEEAFPGTVPRLLDTGMLERTDGRVFLSHKGLLLCNRVVAEFI